MRFVPGPPSMVKTFAPGPLMANEPALLMMISFESVILVRVGAKFIVSSVGEALAALTASRNEQSPATQVALLRSSLLVTVNLDTIPPLPNDASRSPAAAWT